MSSERMMPDDRRGFTLIEVLIAMIILAVGLLGLQALGISAARSVATAEWMTTATATATEYLENALQEIRNHDSDPDDKPESRCVVVGPNRVSVLIDMTVAVLPRVNVTVTPVSGSPADRIVTLTSSAFYAVPLTGPAVGSACS